MTFKDSFPLEIEFEIDRERLLRYLLTQAWLGCFGLMLPFGLMFALFFFDSHMVPYRNTDIWFQFSWLCFYLTGGIIVAALLCCVLYFGYFRPSARLKAKNLRLMVDGPYLRHVSGGFILLDQRYHFRDISSYGTIQGPMLRHHGLKSLSFRLPGRSPTPPTFVTGLVDADRVRDVLCEIDASRELPDAGPRGPTAVNADE